MFYLTEMSSGAAVLTVNISSGTSPYETKESPGEPSLCQKDASHKKPIQKFLGFCLGVLTALVTTVVAVQSYKKRNRLCQSNDSDVQQDISVLKSKRILIIFKFGSFGFSGRSKYFRNTERNFYCFVNAKDSYDGQSFFNECLLAHR